MREGQLLARVRHQNVIVVHGACEIDGEVGIWMDFVRGRTLEQIVRSEGPMSAQEASVVGESLCRALAAVHQAGLLHRDVQPAMGIDPFHFRDRTCEIHRLVGVELRRKRVVCRGRG